MKAFHGDIKVKNKYVKRVLGHIKADNLIRGEGWNGTKGCAVGCTLENYDHAAYETELGIPEWLARVEDTLFEGMSELKSRIWPALFLKVIKPGADLNKAKTPFIVAVLESTLVSMKKTNYDKDKFPEVFAAIEGSKKVVKEMIRCHKEGLSLDAAQSAAEAAVESARSAQSAAWYSVSRSAEAAAWATAWATAEAGSLAERVVSAVMASQAARLAEQAAESAAWASVEKGAKAAAVWSAAEVYDHLADKLIDILKGIK